MRIKCFQCNYVGNVKKTPKGSLGIEILLWLFFLIPGLIYSLWRQGTYGFKCPQCGCENVIKNYKGTIQEKQEKCPFCAEEINSSAIKCKHCGSDLTKWQKQQQQYKHKKQKETEEQEEKTVNITMKGVVTCLLVGLNFVILSSSLSFGALFFIISIWGLTSFWTNKSVKEVLKNNQNYKIISGLTFFLEILIMWEYPILGGLILLLSIWSYSNSDFKTISNRLKKFKTHKTRLILSILLILLVGGFKMGFYLDAIDHEKTIEESAPVVKSQEIKNEKGIKETFQETVAIPKEEAPMVETKKKLPVKVHTVYDDMTYAEIKEFETRFSVMEETCDMVQGKDDCLQDIKYLHTHAKSIPATEWRAGLTDLERKLDKMTECLGSYHWTKGCPQVSSEVITKTDTDSIISNHCQEKWGANLQMFNFCVEQQKEGLQTLALGKPNDISETDFLVIREHCTSKWSKNFQMRVFCEDQQYEGVRTVSKGKPEDIGQTEYNIISNYCSSKWSTNSQMAAFCEDQQYEAVRTLASTTSSKRSSCTNKWSNNFQMRVFCEEQDY